MILVLAGTQDGRELAIKLEKAGFQVMASVVSSYAQDLLKGANVLINARPLDTNELINLLRQNNISLLVDASHPYAVNVSQNAMAACASLGTQYIRYERPVVPLPDYEKLYLVTDYQQAAQTVANLGQIIFLTTGSRRLAAFKSEPLLANHRLIARILPDPQVLKECIDLGFKPSELIAMQGPFSHQLNIALFKERKAEVIVTKNSGQLGGSDTKITAAIELDLPIVIIDRPNIQYGSTVYSCDDVLKLITEA